MLLAYVTGSTGMRPKLEIVVDVILQQLRQEWLAIKCFVQITQQLLFWYLTVGLQLSMQVNWKSLC